MFVQVLAIQFLFESSLYQNVYLFRRKQNKCKNIAMLCYILQQMGFYLQTFGYANRKKSYNIAILTL